MIAHKGKNGWDSRLSACQLRALLFILSQPRAVTIREVQRHLGYRGVNRARIIVNKLKRLGLVQAQPRLARTLRPTCQMAVFGTPDTI